MNIKLKDRLEHEIGINDAIKRDQKYQNIEEDSFLTDLSARKKSDKILSEFE